MSITALTSCNSGSNKDDDDVEPIIPSYNPFEDVAEDPNLVNTIESHTILTGTNDETTVYIIRSNGGGPKIALIGGTHGDETAGWKAALKIKDLRNFRGDVLIIPQCNIQADNRIERYAGLGKTKVNGEYYSDLNRAYPGYDEEPRPATKKIAEAIRKEIIDFGAEHIIDLHESKKSSADADESGGLGNLLIFGNEFSCWPALEIIEYYNKACRKENEDMFYMDTNAPAGSYNAYFGSLLPNGCVFTTETDRDIQHIKGLTEERRIEQQMTLVDLIFKYIYANFWPNK